MQRCITVPNRPCFLTTREYRETGVMNPNSHFSCTSLSQNVTRSLESNFQIGSHITIEQESFRRGAGESKGGGEAPLTESWHWRAIPHCSHLKGTADTSRATTRAVPPPTAAEKLSLFILLDGFAKLVSNMGQGLFLISWRNSWDVVHGNSVAEPVLILQCGMGSARASAFV